jgi:TolB-like protein
MVLPRFLKELKRRNVYRAAIVYAGVGWVVLEAADVVLPRLGFPDWTVNVVLAVVLLGFPLALVFAWIFDLNTHGIVRTPPISPEIQLRFSVTSIVEFVVICILVAMVGYLYVDRLSLQERLVEPVVREESGAGKTAVTNPEKYRAIAVLPFADMSEAGDQAWFAEGIAEEMLIALSQVDQLNVMARTSSFSFKGTDKTVAEIADILGVQAVLEGSVRRSGDRVRITAQLIDASSGYHIWTGSYERQLTDIFRLQDELARSIVKTLRVKLGVDYADPLIIAHTENLEAYEWFLRGRVLVNWANPDSVVQSVINLERAVELDPNYALAWGYLSFARFTTVLYRPFDEVSSGIVSAYERALTLDPELSMALAVKAFMTQVSSYNYEEAGRLYQQSIAFRPDALSMAAYSFWYLVAIDEGELAIKFMREAERLDPLHSGLKNNFTMLLRVLGETEAAVL